ncbi:MAG: SRPBCC family protein [Solirubrobacterales bacterium]
MRSRTVTTVLPAPREEVFRYLSDVERLPEWANEFARELKREGDRYKVVNNLGEYFFDIVADPDTGVIDMYAGPAPGAMTLFPTRVVGLPGGSTAYTFTMFQGPDMPDELFGSQYESLKREFRNIEAVFSPG